MIPGTANTAGLSGAAGGGTVKTVFITSTGAFTIPADFVSLVAIEAIGAGANGTNGVPFISNGNPGGGGAYAKNDTLSGLSAGGTLYCQIGVANGSATTAQTWANKTSNAAPSSTTDGVLAKGASGRTGGDSSTSIGTVKYSGGSGYIAGSSGGGGAGGPGGAGVTADSSGAGGAGNAGLSGGGVGGASSGGAGGAGTYWVQTSNGATAGPGGGGGNGPAGGAAGAGGNYGSGGGAARFSGAVGGTGGAGKGGFIAFTYMST